MHCKSGKKFNGKILQICTNLWRDRYRLYQNEILQENVRSTAFFKLYKICILLHRCNLKIYSKKYYRAQLHEIGLLMDSKFLNSLRLYER